MLHKIAKKTKIVEILSILFLGLFLYFGMHYAEMIDERALSAINAHSAEGMIVYITLITFMVLFIPISTIPIVPFAIKGLGPIVGGLATLFAWEISSYIAFNFARKHRAFFKKHFLLVKKTEKYVHSFLKPYSFLKIFILRLIFPIGIMSYVFGFSRGITKKQHCLVSTTEFIITILFTTAVMYTPEKIKPFLIFVIFLFIAQLAIKTILKMKS